MNTDCILHSFLGCESRAPVHLVGVKDANRGVSFYFTHNECVNGANLTLNVLCSHLSKIGDLSKKKLYLQLDNTVAENKNWAVVTFCSLLVAMKRVKSIKINFLPVGHTHIDIDQVFGVLNKSFLIFKSLEKM